MPFTKKFFDSIKFKNTVLDVIQGLQNLFSPKSSDFFPCLLQFILTGPPLAKKLMKTKEKETPNHEAALEKSCNWIIN